MKEISLPPNRETLVLKLDELMTFVKDSVHEGIAAHEVEERIWWDVLSLGRTLFGMFFEMCGDGNVGKEVQLPDGRTVRKLEGLRYREYVSVFGYFELNRRVYGKREGQKIEYVPLDARFQLPAGKFSYLLQDWDQSLVVESPYARINDTLRKVLGFSQCVDSVERMTRQMSVVTDEFWENQPVPPVSEEGALMVCSADGKGVPICTEVKEAAIDDHQPEKGPKPNRKKMALLGATYTVDPFPRKPEEIVASLFRSPQEKASRSSKRPKPQHKRIRASLSRCESGTTKPDTEKIFGWMGHEISTRNPSGQKPMIVLMDGQESLWQAAKEYLPGATIEILDLLHVTPRLWKAAKIFCPGDYDASLSFIKKRILYILQGKTLSMVRGLRWLGSHQKIKGSKKPELERICQYFEKNEHRMRYHEYLAAGYPIATGVIEGACRHLVKDRLERAGMRWVLKGAQAMLHIRSVYLSGLWDKFLAFWREKERERLYPYAELTQAVNYPLPA